MAGSYVSLVMQARLGCDPTAKLVLAALADCANINDHGMAYPSIGRLASRAEISESQARRIVHNLVTDGWLMVEQASNGGCGKATKYRLNLSKLRASANQNPSAHDTVNPSADARVNGSTHARVQAVDNSPTPSTHAQKTLAPMRENPSTHDTLSVKNRKLTGSTEAPVNLGVLLRTALNGNRNPIDKPIQEQPEERQPETPAPAQPIGLKVVTLEKPRSQAEQVAWVEHQLLKTKPH